MHHVINKSKLRGNPKAKHYCEKVHPEIMLVPMCALANVSRLADSKAGCAIVLRRLSNLWGEEYVRGVVDGIPWSTPQPDLRYEALVANLPEGVID
jgi:hypothetical protein